jgi:WD40 repeat protein
VRLWDAKSGECRFILVGHTDSVMAVAFSPDGSLMATGGFDRTLRIWDISTGQCRARVEELPSHMSAVDWSSCTTANKVVISCGDGSVLMWKYEEEKRDQYKLRLQWSATSGSLIVTGASIQDVQGLTHPNKQLLKQRGAVGEPINQLRETSKTMLKLATVISRLKRSMGGQKSLDSSSSGQEANPLEQEQQSNGL